MGTTSWSQTLGKEATRAAGWVFGRLDTLAALLGGAIAAVLAAKGGLKGQDLGTAILSLLSVVAFSMVVERSLRLKASHGIDDVRADLKKTREALRVLESGSPYHVTVNESTWDIGADGTANLERRKHLRFSQDEVVAVLDWLKADGVVQNIQYRPPPGKRIHSYDSDGRQHVLVALDRPYARDEELDFYIERTVEHCFVKTPDRVTVYAIESTSLIKMTVRWPLDRPPRAVRFYRRTDAERRKPVTLQAQKGVNGRAEVQVDAQDPDPGERICIEWDWDPPPAPTSADGAEPNGVAANAITMDSSA
jgi:membrane protein implicated in regulation of membrane protease activity